MAIIKVCSHCGEIISRSDTRKKFCNYCNSSGKRKEMDENNRKLFEENGLEYHCKFCG